MFVTFEGLDFSGKTTQAQRLVEKLQRSLQGNAEAQPGIHFLREPGGTGISERLRDILLDKKNLEMSDLTELLLFSASRAQLVTQVILPALRRNEIVICDRYYDSTTAYQGFGRGLDLDAICRINAIATEGTPPDVTFLVDITVEEVERRKVAAGLTFDRMESSGRAFYERVRMGYRTLAKQEPDRIILINGMAPIGAVEEEIWGHFINNQRKWKRS